MQIDILPDADAAAARAAAVIADEARAAVAARGRFVLAVSGGTTPWIMLKRLAAESLPWDHIYVAQIDERAAPDGDPDRNLTHLKASLAAAPLPAANLLPMPVTGPDLDAAAAEYVRTLEAVAGAPFVLDLAHLGLGPDGHTASLVPGDPVLDVTDRDVATTGVYQKRRRMTLTYRALDRARKVLWLVTGNKAEMLRRLRDGDQSIPAGRVSQANAAVVADAPAAAELGG